MGFIEMASQLAIKAVEKLPLERILFRQRESQTSLEVLEKVARERDLEHQTIVTTTTATQELKTTSSKEAVATACIPCAVNHFSTSAGLLNEAVRFKGDGMTSNEILDRIAKTLEEQNALERVDLSPEKIQDAPDWERGLIDEALQQSRELRHRLETITTVKELEQAAAGTESYYKKLFRDWKRLRSAARKAEPELTLESAKKIAAEEAAREVEARWRETKSTT